MFRIFSSIIGQMKLFGLICGLGALTAPLVGQKRTVPPDRIVAVAHQIISERFADSGIAVGLPQYLTEDATMIWPGLPVIVGRQRIAAILKHQAAAGRADLLFQPLKILPSVDGSMVLDHGLLSVVPASGGNATAARYAAVWVPVGTAWRIDALIFNNISDVRAAVWPDSVAWRSPESLHLSGQADSFAVEDIRFADSARNGKVSTTFGEWAAQEAIKFASSGTLVVGPEAIAKEMARFDATKWSWRPLSAGASKDGKLGWTVGEGSVILPSDENGKESSLTRIYITFWRRAQDGSNKYIYQDEIFLH